MDFLIRECCISDVEAIQRLNTLEMGYVYSLHETRSKLERLLQGNYDRIFVAVVEDEVVGYIHANDYDVLYAPHMKNIMGIAVSSGYHRQGIGRALLQAVENWAVQTGAACVRLVSGAERTGAHGFYQSCGYANGKKQLNFKKSV